MSLDISGMTICTISKWLSKQTRHTAVAGVSADDNCKGRLVADGAHDIAQVLTVSYSDR